MANFGIGPYDLDISNDVRTIPYGRFTSAASKFVTGSALPFVYKKAQKVFEDSFDQTVKAWTSNPTSTTKALPPTKVFKNPRTGTKTTYVKSKVTRSKSKTKMPRRRSTRRVVRRRTRRAPSRSFKNAVTTKMTGNFLLTTTPGGNLHYLVSLRDPSAIFQQNGSGTPSMATAAINWTAFADMYDQYKVNWVKLQYIPKNPDNTKDNQNTPQVFYVHDDALIQPVAGVASAMLHPQHKVVESSKSHSYFVRPRAINGTNSIAKGFYDTSNPKNIGTISAITVPRNAVAEDYGTLMVTYSVTFVQLTA